jgi:hypothetical protein
MQKPTDQRGSFELKAGGKSDSPACSRGDTRLLIPPLANPRDGDAALKQVVGEWLLPRLLEEFLAEKGITPKSRFGAKPAI